MKYFIVLACLLVVSHGLAPEIAEKIKERMLQMGAECKGETSVGDDDVALIRNHQNPTTQAGKCFLACVFKKMTFLDASGKIDKDAINKKIDMMKPLDESLYNKMRQVVDTCTAEVTDAADECETAFNIHVCFQRERVNVDMPTLNFNS